MNLPRFEVFAANKIIDSDFTHDAMLTINGDFADERDELAYTRKIVAILNAAQETDEQLRAENARLREALARLLDWGGIKYRGNYSSTIVGGVLDWVETGCAGNLPDLPEWARRDNESTKSEHVSDGV